MSDLTALVDRGAAWLESKVPKMFRIDGGALLVGMVDFVGRKTEWADETRQRQITYSAKLEVRRVHLDTAPADGATVLLDSTTYRVVETHTDEATITLFLDSAAK